MAATVSPGEVADPREPDLSTSLFHDPGEPLSTIGEGRGVIVTIGPSPGEENAEEGDKEPSVLLDA